MIELLDINDLIAAYGSKKLFADAMDCHPAQVTRWGDTLPDSRQIQAMRLLDADPYMRKRAKDARRKRLEVSS